MHPTTQNAGQTAMYSNSAPCMDFIWGRLKLEQVSDLSKKAPTSSFWLTAMIPHPKNAVKLLLSGAHLRQGAGAPMLGSHHNSWTHSSVNLPTMLSLLCAHMLSRYSAAIEPRLRSSRAPSMLAVVVSSHHSAAGPGSVGENRAKVVEEML